MVYLPPNFNLSYWLSLGRQCSHLFIRLMKRPHNEEHINHHQPPSKVEGIAWCIAFTLDYTVGARFMLWKARFDKTFYAYQVFGQIVVLQASLISAALITCERFHAVYWPLKHRILSMGAYRASIFVVWILAILFPILQLLISNKLALYTFVSILLSLFFTVCICNIAIWRRLQRRIASQQQNREAQNRRLTKTLLLISAVEISSWLPLTINNLLVIAFEVPVPLAILFTSVAVNYSNFVLAKSNHLCIRVSGA